MDNSSHFNVVVLVLGTYFCNCLVDTYNVLIGAVSTYRVSISLDFHIHSLVLAILRFFLVDPFTDRHSISTSVNSPTLPLCLSTSIIYFSPLISIRISMLQYLEPHPLSCYRRIVLVLQ